jgi:hypothetical protein
MIEVLTTVLFNIQGIWVVIQCRKAASYLTKKCSLSGSSIAPRVAIPENMGLSHN